MRELTPEEVASLQPFVDHAMVAWALERLNADMAQLGQVRSEWDAARAVVTDAETASAHAIASGGDAMGAERALEEARRALSVAEKVVAHATTVAETAAQAHAAAVIQAHAPAYAHGVLRRIEAARKADQARAMLAEAEAEHQAGAAVLAYCGAHMNYPHPVMSVVWDQPCRTEELERKIWENANFDPALYPPPNATTPKGKK